MTFQTLVLPVALSLASALTVLPEVLNAESLDAALEALPQSEKKVRTSDRTKRADTQANKSAKTRSEPAIDAKPQSEKEVRESNRAPQGSTPAQRPLTKPQGAPEDRGHEPFGQWVSEQARNGVTGRELAEAIRAEKARRGMGKPDHAGHGKGKGKH